MLAQFVEDLIHLKGRENRFDQHRGADGTLRDPERVLAEHKHVVPEPRFQVTLHFRQVEVRPRAGCKLVRRIVDAHGASIEVTSQVGRGSQFSMGFARFSPKINA